LGTNNCKNKSNIQLALKAIVCWFFWLKYNEIEFSFFIKKEKNRIKKQKSQEEIYLKIGTQYAKIFVKNIAFVSEKKFRHETEQTEWD